MPHPFRSPRHLGDWAELLFLVKAVALGLDVSIPFGVKRYDVLVHTQRRTLRVQVKCVGTRSSRGSAYHVPIAHRRPYTADDIDLLAAYLYPHATWYLFPVARLPAGSSLAVRPDDPHDVWARYREAWHLLRRPAATSALDLDACAASPQSWR